MDDWITRSLKEHQRLFFVVFSIIILISLFFYIGIIYELMGELIAWLPISFVGDSTDGIVTKQTTVESEGTFYQLEFGYLVTSKQGENKAFSNKLLVSQSFWRRHEPGSSVNIRYLPWYPRIARINGHPYELNMWLVTFFLYSAFMLQLVLIPVVVMDVAKKSRIKGLIMCLRIGGITMFIVTIVVLILEFILDSLGINLGIFSGGAIPLIIGLASGSFGALLIWRRQELNARGQTY